MNNSLVKSKSKLTLTWRRDIN